MGWVTSRFALPHQLVGLLVYEVRRMTANDSRWSTDPMGTRAYCLKWGDVRMRVVTACILSFGGWRKFSNIYWSVFVGSGGSSYPPKNIVQKIWKLYSGEANRVRLVEADTWHCLAYLTGADLVKLSWQNSSKLCKKSSTPSHWICKAFSLHSNNSTMLTSILVIQIGLKCVEAD